MELNCGLVQGVMTMGACPALPIQGIDVILGNDLAGYWTPLLLDYLVTRAKYFLGVFTVCASPYTVLLIKWGVATPCPASGLSLAACNCVCRCQDSRMKQDTKADSECWISQT